MTEVLIEHKFSFPIRNPESAGVSRSFRFCGKVDRFDPATGVITDWKTVADPSRYIMQKTISFQPELYALGLMEDGHKPEMVEYRLITRPTIKLKKTQTPPEYQIECENWLTQPGKIVEHRLPLSPERIEAARHWAWDIARDIVERRRNGRWHPNESSCWNFGSPCEFLALCESVATGTDTGWLIEEHFEPREYGEEYEDPLDSRDVLSYSSGSCYVDCARRYFFRFERALQRKKQDRGDALRIGSLFHQAAEKGEAGIAWLWSQEFSGAASVDESARKRNQELIAKAAAMLSVSLERWSS